MAVFTHDCPHCQTKDVAFNSIQGVPIQGSHNNLWNLFATCARCGVGVVAKYKSMARHDPHSVLNTEPGQFKLEAVYPSPDKLEAPEHLPENVEAFFLQAVGNRRMNYDAAGAMYRKALDVGLKAKFPEDEFPEIKGTLFRRIKKAAKLGEITAELGGWAHHIRLEGNDAAHDEDPYTEEEVAALHRFTELVLMYLFTLPGMLAAAQEEPHEDEKPEDRSDGQGDD